MNNKKNSIKESLKTIISILLNIICFYFIAPYIPFFQLTNIYNAIIIIIGLTLINRLIWPILSYYSLPFLVFTFGLGTLILNGVIIWIISKITSGIIVTGLGIIILPFMLTFINTVITYILDIDNESMYYRNIL